MQVQSMQPCCRGGGAGCQLLGVHMNSLHTDVCICLSSSFHNNILIINLELHKNTQNLEYL